MGRAILEANLDEKPLFFRDRSITAKRLREGRAAEHFGETCSDGAALAVSPKTEETSDDRKGSGVTLETNPSAAIGEL